MKFAVLSDIHSNVFALEAVIKDLQKHSVDFIVNLGDILYGPISPRATYELLMQHDIITISGNQDRQIFEATPREITTNPTMKFILEDLGTEPIDWMKSLPFDFQLSDNVYLCHGTPKSDLIYLLENVELGYARLRSDKAILSLLNGNETKLICCGHTHIPRTVTLSTGQIVVNPGSVGLQAYTDDEPSKHSMENYNAMASYALISSAKNNWQVDHVNVPYDVASAVAQCKIRERHDWVHFLSTGRKV